MFLIEFDPVEVGNQEVGWWRAHNEQDKQKMAQFLVRQHTLLYSMSEEEANQALRPLVEATKYHDIRDWDQAVERVTKYYEAIKKRASLDFDPKEMAKLEVGWWKLHDELEGNPDKSPLARAFAKLYATQFGIGLDKMRRVGELKAQATYEHDLAEESNISNEEAEKHWQKAGKLLVDFYTELKRVLSGKN